MVVLGIGTNQGDRLTHLRRALQHLEKIPDFHIQQVSPLYISDALLPENAPPEWDVPYINLAVRCETTLSPEDLLFHVKNIEKTLGRKPTERWGPRIIDIDLLAWDDLVQENEKLHIPHRNLHERPFALWPLSDVAPLWVYPFPSEHQGKIASVIAAQWGSRFSGDAPLHARQIPHRIDTPELMGILNITPDSFSDGGKFYAPAHAVQQAKKLVEAGATILDIGAESTGPSASALDPATEWERLEPVLQDILACNFSIKPKISIDTRHVQVAEKALQLGVDYINDVSGLQDPAMQHLLASHSCDVVIMHHLRIPEDRSISLSLHESPLPTVHAWAKERIETLEKNGISRERLIFDIGIGYGKNAAQSMFLLKSLSYFRDLGVRLLVGHSRKSFLEQLTTLKPQERDLETVILSLFLAKQSVDILRVHDVDSHARAFKMAAECENLK